MTDFKTQSTPLLAIHATLTADNLTLRTDAYLLKKEIVRLTTASTDTTKLDKAKQDLQDAILTASKLALINKADTDTANSSLSAANGLIATRDAEIVTLNGNLAKSNKALDDSDDCLTKATANIKKLKKENKKLIEAGAATAIKDATMEDYKVKIAQFEALSKHRIFRDYDPAKLINYIVSLMKKQTVTVKDLTGAVFTTVTVGSADIACWCLLLGELDVVSGISPL